MKEIQVCKNNNFTFNSNQCDIGKYSHKYWCQLE